MIWTAVPTLHHFREKQPQGQTSASNCLLAPPAPAAAAAPSAALPLTLLPAAPAPPTTASLSAPPAPLPFSSSFPSSFSSCLSTHSSCSPSSCYTPTFPPSCSSCSSLCINLSVVFCPSSNSRSMLPRPAGGALKHSSPSHVHVQVSRSATWWALPPLMMSFRYRRLSPHLSASTSCRSSGQMLGHPMLTSPSGAVWRLNASLTI